jgi:hypothetical protein
VGFRLKVEWRILGRYHGIHLNGLCGSDDNGYNGHETIVGIKQTISAPK